LVPHRQNYPREPLFFASDLLTRRSRNQTGLNPKVGASLKVPPKARGYCLRTTSLKLSCQNDAEPDDIGTKSLSELSSALRVAGSDHRCQRQAETNLSPLRDAVGSISAAARRSRLFEAGAKPGGLNSNSSREERHRKRAPDAGSQTQVVCPLSDGEAQCLRVATQEGCGNAGLWKPRKTKGRFPSVPIALGNR